MTGLPVARPWFRATSLGNGVTLLLEPHVHVLEQANIFLVEGGQRDMVIDAGMGVAPLAPVLDALRRDPAKPLICVLTHTHIDHMGSAHEFDTRLVHPSEADELARPTGPQGLSATDFSPAARALFLEAGYPPLSDLLIDAVTFPDFDPLAWRLSGCERTGLLDEGDRVDLGGRVFDVLHLPGHSPGGIGLLEAGTGVLFAGDAIYDGPLIWKGSGMDVAAYDATLRRLRDLPVSIVNGGHDPSFGPDRMREICDEYLARFEAT